MIINNDKLDRAFTRKNKQTTDLAKGLMYFIGKATIQEFYAKRSSKGHNIMDEETFGTVKYQISLSKLPKKYYGRTIERSFYFRGGRATAVAMRQL